MSGNPNKLSKFWQELKRRKVIRVIIVYATTAFILLQLVDILLEPLHLPHWVMTFFVVLLLVGFPIAVIFSWIFDITPQGVEVTKAVEGKVEKESIGIFSKKYLIFDIIIGALLVVVVILAYPKIFKSNSGSELEKSIAVLPFINESIDSTNANFINGLREDILTKLQNINDLRVVSSTSGDKYKNSRLSISEIATELGVSYILEGKGQKLGNRVKLNLNLIDAIADEQLWNNHFIREINNENLYEMQEEVAFTVAHNINAKITPEEEERIKKVPTKSMLARDYYYTGIQLAHKGGKENLEQAITFYNKAIEEDNKFALAYAQLTNTYSRLYNENNDDEYLKEIYINANNAILSDPQLPESYYAKAIDSYYKTEFKLSEKFLLKTIELNSNYYPAYNFLSFMHRPGGNSPDVEKYVEYVLKALYLDIPNDSIGLVQLIDSYYNLAVSLRTTGFFDDSMTCINKILEFEPNNSRVLIFKVGLIRLINNDSKAENETLHKINMNDSTYSFTFRQIGLSYFRLKDFPNALKWYEKWLSLIGSNFTDYKGRDSGRLAVILYKMGKSDLANVQIEKCEEQAMDDIGYIRNLLMLQVYAFRKDSVSAINQIKKLSQVDMNYGFFLTLNDEPTYDNVRDLPDFKQMLTEIETKFFAYHNKIKANLTEKGLLPIKL